MSREYFGRALVLVIALRVGAVGDTEELYAVV